jgi:hypothetical protein
MNATNTTTLILNSILVVDNAETCIDNLKNWINIHSASTKVFGIPVDNIEGDKLESVVDGILKVNPQVVIIDAWALADHGACPDEVVSLAGQIPALAAARGFTGQIILSKGSDDSHEQCFCTMTRELVNFVG